MVIEPERFTPAWWKKRIPTLPYMEAVKHMRDRFCSQLSQTAEEEGMLELISVPFIANEPAIFGKPNLDWHRRELAWYRSQSLCVHDIEEPIPQIWLDVADSKGMINSNYGWCILSEENGYQFENVVRELADRRDSRQGTMIYTRPSMHGEAKVDDRYDFMCTNTTQHMIRDGYLIYIVNMRSSDAVFGYKGDLAWHQHVQGQLILALEEQGVEVKEGPIIWNANSFHIYPRHRYLVKEWGDDEWENGA